VPATRDGTGDYPLAEIEVFAVDQPTGFDGGMLGVGFAIGGLAFCPFLIGWLMRLGLACWQSFGLLSEISLLHRQLISDVVFVDIGYVGDGLLPDFFGRNQFHIGKPDVRIKTHTDASLRSFAMRFGPAL